MRPPIDIAVDTDFSPTNSRGIGPFSPTACPGPSEFPVSSPMFPDMRRDDFMSKSTASTRETYGDFWSMSATSDDQYRPYHSRYRGHQDTQGQRGGLVDKPTQNQHTNRDISQGPNRLVNSMEWKQDQPPASPKSDLRLPSHASSRLRQRSEFLGTPSSRRVGEMYHGRLNDTFQHTGVQNGIGEQRRPQHYYEDEEYPPQRAIRDSPGLNRRNATPKSKRERSQTFEAGRMQGGRLNDTFQNTEVQDRVGDYRRPQYYYEDEDYLPQRNARDTYGEKDTIRSSPSLNRRQATPKSKIKRSQTFEVGEVQGSRGGRCRRDRNHNHQTERGHDHERFFAELQRDGSFSADNVMYDQLQIQRGNNEHSQETSRWYNGRVTGRRFGDQSDNEGYYERRRERTTPDGIRNQYKEGINVDRVDEQRRNRAEENFYRREEGLGTLRRYDDLSPERFVSNNEPRKGIRNGTEEIEDNSSLSFSDTSGDGRARGRSSSRARSRRRDRSTEKNRHIGKGKSHERTEKKSSEFLIDIVQSGVERRPIEQETAFSPPKEGSKFKHDTLPPAARDIEDPPEKELYARRIADANLMKEQSEARHQILREVRQAMEMRDLSTDTNNRHFWERQIKTLNASLKRLWDVDTEESLTEDQDSFDLKAQQENLRIFHFNESTTPTQSNTKGNKTPNYNASQESPTALSPTSVNNFTTVKVQAPENLPADHQFTIRVNGKQMKAQVPSGGVRKDDVFTIKIPLNDTPVPTTPAPTPQTPSFSVMPHTPSSVNNSTVKVKAPASMPEGYRFTAKMADRTIVATVPRGGVQKGEVFVVRVDQ